MSTCPDLGHWRAYLDRALPSAEHDRLTSHLLTCPTCRLQIDRARQAALFARERLADLGGATPAPAATHLAWQHLQSRLNDQPSPRTLPERITAMLARLASRPARLAASSALAGLILLVALVVTPAGSEALQALSVFRVQTFKAITIEVDPATMKPADDQRRAIEKRRDQADPDKMREEIEKELAAAGITLNTSVTDRTVREVADLAAARAAAPTGVKVQAVTALPGTLQHGAPKVYVADPAKSVLTVDLVKFRKTLAERQKDAPKGAPPIDPSQLPGINPNVTSIAATLQTAFSVVQVYGEGEKALVFAQGASPVLTLSEGVDILAIRDALVAAPGLPKTTRTQLLSIRDDEWDRTLIIPVPTGTIVKDVRVGGALGLGGDAALLILDPHGKGGAVLWQRNGTLYAVAGGYGESDLLRAANSVK